MRYRGALVCVLVVALCVLPACSMKAFMKKTVAHSMIGMLEEVDHAIQMEPSAAYGREASPSLLKMLDGVIASNPCNCELLAMGNRQNAQFAMSFIDGVDDDWARSLYSKSVTYGLRALADPCLEAAMKRGAPAVRHALRAHGRNQVGLLFWTGLGVGGRIGASKDDVRALADLPIAMAFMDRVIQLEPGYFHGGAYLFRGHYYGGRPKALGGDPEKAREAYEKAIALSNGKFLMAKVQMAQHSAIPTQNRELFDKLLNEVLEAPDDILPDELLATAIAKQKAETLLMDVDDHFIGGP